MQKDNMMITGDALLDFGDGHKIKRSAKPGWYIYHSLPASHQAIFFPCIRLEKNGVMTWNIKFLPTTRWQPKCIKPVMHLKNSMAWCLNFPWVGYLPPIIWNCVLTRKKVQRQILHVPGFWAELSWHLRQRTTSKTKALYNKV